MSEETLEETVAFDFTDDDLIDVTKVGEMAAQAFYQSIQNASNGTARSQQQQEKFIGMSNLGHCRQYAKYMMEQREFTDDRDKTAAFFGTVAGDAIEAQIKLDHPEWLIQHRLYFPIPSGGEIPGTCDILIPWEASSPYSEWVKQFEVDENGELTYDGPPLYLQGIWDGKSKAELQTIKKYGPNQQQIMQVHGYAKAAIAAGLLNPDEPILVGDVFFDRSGKDQMPHGAFHVYSEDVVGFIDEWINDVKYAVIHGEDASRDKPREWCWSYCEYATLCRGHDTDVQGLIQDPELLQAAEMHIEGGEMKKAGQNLQDAAKLTLERLPSGGSTGTHNVRWVDVQPSEMKAYTRAGYRKLDIRPVPKAKPKKAAKK